MNEPVYIVMLRRPRLNNPNEKRSDPFWEFGSFGRTGCHCRNLMHPGKAESRTGARLAFAQGGDDGFRLVFVTPPIIPAMHGPFAEATWSPAAMPLRYAEAPVLIDNSGHSDIPSILSMIADVDRSTPVARFSSRFRTRSHPVSREIAKEIIDIFSDRHAQPALRAGTYEEALPCLPPIVDRNREKTFFSLL